jgi:hypothetical protein|tara:strand:- start:3190 stop:3483 length:294 start_codon:yes stop_codon:yes gene_type:complete
MSLIRVRSRRRGWPVRSRLLEPLVEPASIWIGGQSLTTVAHSGELVITLRHVVGATLPPSQQHAVHADLLPDFGEAVPAGRVRMLIFEDEYGAFRLY